MEYVKLVNRTTRTLQGVWNGRQFAIAPGEHSFPAAQARKFRDQNPIMGTEDPFTLQKQYYIGIEEDMDDCTPLEGAPSQAVELLDRSKLGDTNTYKLVQTNGLYNPRRDPGSNPPLSAGNGDIASSFVNPRD